MAKTKETYGDRALIRGSLYLRNFQSGTLFLKEHSIFLFYRTGRKNEYSLCRVSKSALEPKCTLFMYMFFRGRIFIFFVSVVHTWVRSWHSGIAFYSSKSKDIMPPLGSCVGAVNFQNLKGTETEITRCLQQKKGLLLQYVWKCSPVDRDIMSKKNLPDTVLLPIPRWFFFKYVLAVPKNLPIP